MTTTVTLHSGSRTIGGVCVSVEHAGAKVVLDFGSPYVPEAQVFDGRVEPRQRSWVADSIRLGLFPRVDGVYAAEDLALGQAADAADAAGGTEVPGVRGRAGGLGYASGVGDPGRTDGAGVPGVRGRAGGVGDDGEPGGTDGIGGAHGIGGGGGADGIGGLVPAERSTTETAVFISTLYLDHMAAIGAVADRVPVFLGPAARQIELAMETCGLGVRSRRSGYESFEFDRPVRVGLIEVLPITSYTDGFGSCSFLVATPDGTVHWTGNLTIDGFESGNALAEADRLRERGLDLLFCDATRFSLADELSRAAGPDGLVRPTLDPPPGAPTTAELDGLLARTIAECRGLAVVNVYQRELASIRKLLAYAADAGRTVLFEPDAAHVVRQCLGLRPSVYRPDSARWAAPAGRPDWLARLLAECPVVAKAEVAADPRRFLVQNSDANILELLSWPSAGGVYIHLDGEPVGPYDPAWDNMARIVDRAGFALARFDYNDVVGHAFPGAVKYYVDRADPKVLAPCHSTRPELLTAARARQFLPTDGQPFSLTDL